MQLGFTMFENMEFDAGQVTNASFADYKIPGIHDIPPAIENHIVLAEQGGGPFGAKGVGESATFGVSPAIANAIHDAVGVRLTDLPLTAESVLSDWFQAITPEDSGPLPEIDTSVAHIARVYDYWLGGKDNSRFQAPPPKPSSEAQCIKASRMIGAGWQQQDGHAWRPSTPGMGRWLADRTDGDGLAEVERFFEGLDLVEPGLVRGPEWRSRTDQEMANPAALWAGVARKN